LEAIRKKLGDITKDNEVKTNFVVPNSLLDVDMKSPAEVKNPMRYPKQYLGTKEEKQQQIAEDLADVSTDEEFTKLEKNYREKKLDEYLGEDSGSDKEFLLSKHPSLISPSGSETEGGKSNNERKKRYQKKHDKIKFPKSENKQSSTLKNQDHQNSMSIVTENTSSQVIFDKDNKIPDISDENPDHIEVSAKRMLNFSNEDSDNPPGIIMFKMISKDIFTERMITLKNGKKLLMHKEDENAFIKHEIKYDNLVFHSEGLTSGPHAVLHII
jgi:hypothetical protein